MTILSLRPVHGHGWWCSRFAQKLRGLDAKNPQHEPYVEELLTESEEALFDKVKEDNDRPR